MMRRRSDDDATMERHGFGVTRRLGYGATLERRYSTIISSIRWLTTVDGVSKKRMAG
jgi:hypothetical protein